VVVVVVGWAVVPVVVPVVVVVVVGGEGGGGGGGWDGGGDGDRGGGGGVVAARAVVDLVPAHQVEPVLHEVKLVIALHCQHVGRARHHRSLQLAAPAVVLRHKATELAAACVKLHREAHRVEQTGRADGHDRVPHPACATRALGVQRQRGEGSVREKKKIR